jgi:ferric-dicitrate binding protein FerR (iron transport regulator)
MEKMNFNNTTLPEEEKRWTAFLNGELVDSDQSAADSQVRADFKAVWEEAGTTFCYSAVNTDEAWINLQQKMNKSNLTRLKFFQLRVFQYAAMLLVAIGLGYASYLFIQDPATQVVNPVRIMVAETGPHPSNPLVVNLPDGTTVKMNANTRIEYPESFDAAIRQVKLSGEAFFEVTRDTVRPFVIGTENASVEVLGTSFNVSAYPSAELVEVNVETGKVKLTQFATGKSDRKSAVLPAGERGLLKIAEGEIFVQHTLSPNYASWITKKLFFQHTPLTEAFTVLENTYHVKFKMDDPAIGDIPYTANFADLNLDYIIDIIARTHHLNAKREGDEIIFSRMVN